MPDLLTAEMVANDMDIMDGLTNVIVQSRNPDTGAVLLTVENVVCLRRVVTVKALGVGEGEVPETTARFHLKARSVGFTPKKRDAIVDADGTWIIDSAALETFGTRYRCETTKVVT